MQSFNRDVRDTRQRRRYQTYRIASYEIFFESGLDERDVRGGILDVRCVVRQAFVLLLNNF
ncbi:MAG: hypothetical protein C5S49_07740 [Candidatus Methanogaster sp.]|nr:MAG: hypothetical protein C5S49_07740 [ANME-2 cluster archaeon]